MPFPTIYRLHIFKIFQLSTNHDGAHGSPKAKSHVRMFSKVGYYDVG
jgi:hypothetical protein